VNMGEDGRMKGALRNYGFMYVCGSGDISGE